MLQTLIALVMVCLLGLSTGAIDDLVPVTAENVADLTIIRTTPVDDDTPLTTAARVVLSPDETRIATGVYHIDAAFIEIRDVSNGDLLARINPPLDAVVDKFAFSPDGTQIRAFGQDQYFVYDSSTGDLLDSGTQPYFASTTVFNQDGTLALMLSDSLDALHVVDVVTRDSLVVVDAPAGDRAFSPDASLFAYETFDPVAERGAIAVHDTASGEALHRLDDLPGNIRQIAIHADNMRLAYATDERVTVVEIDGGDVLSTVAFEGLSITALAYGGELLYVARGGILYALDEDGDIRTQVSGESDFIDDLAISAGNTAIFGAAGGVTVLWGVNE